MNPRHMTLVAAAWLLSGAAMADTSIRAGDHPGFGRVVIDLTAGQGFETVRAGERVLVVLSGAGVVKGPPRLPRNVAGIEGGLDTATIILAPGVEPRVTRLGNRLVIDALDRPAASRPAVPARTVHRDATEPPTAVVTAPPMPAAPMPSPPMPAPAVRSEPSAPPTKTTPTATGTPSAQPTRRDAVETPVVTTDRALNAVRSAASPTAGTSPVSTSETPSAKPTALDKPAAPPNPSEPAAPRAPPDTSPAAVLQSPLRSTAPEPAPVIPAAIVLPADTATGAASFRRGGIGVVVLDRRIVGAGVSMAPSISDAGSAGMFQMALPPGTSLRLTRVPAGWSVELAAEPDAAAAQPVASAAGTLFPVPRPGRVVTVLDPLSGATLLVGTSLDTSVTAMQSMERRTPAFVLLPSWVGVVVEAASDATDLRAVQTGFLLSGGILAPAAPAVAMTRRFDLPGGDAPSLTNRMKAQFAGAAMALPRARARERLAAVATMVALGMGAEAQAMAQLALAEDPQVAADAGSQGLVAIAAVLAGRPDEAEALDDPRLDGTDEIQLWRGLRDRRLGKATVAAQGLGGKAPLALAYPATLGRLIFSDIAEAAVETGAAFPEDRLPPYAKAVLLERRGKRDEALAAFEALSQGTDRLDQMRGAAKAAELRLASGQLSSREAAAVMERQSFAWRGDAREAALRMRAAELQGLAGEWRGALDALREIEVAFPDQKTAVRARMAGVMQAMLAADGGALSPLDVVLLAMEHADAVMSGDAGAALSQLLAAKLSALDLPARAIPVLQGLMRGVPPGEARATLGGRLAQVLLDGEEPDAALAALDASGADGMPGSLLESRALLRARAQAALGDTASAAAGLAGRETAAADELRASLLAKAGDWQGATAALASLAARVVPATGPLDAAAQEILLRQATAATQAGDSAALRVLAASAERLTAPRDAMFRVLTAAPITTVSDLPRAARELRLARALPQQSRVVGR